MPVATALEGSQPLAQLLRRLQEAKQHYQTICPLLPPGLRADVRAGQVDGDTWTLLASHNPAAAKLRQMLPLLLDQLRAAGWQGSAIKVKVQPRLPMP